MQFLGELIAALVTAALPAPSSKDIADANLERKESHPIAKGVFMMAALLIVVAGFIFLAFL